MTELAAITKKYGATGVLACWLWFTNSRVEDLENKLINCYQSQARIEQLDILVPIESVNLDPNATPINVTKTSYLKPLKI